MTKAKVQWDQISQTVHTLPSEMGRSACIFEHSRSQNRLRFTTPTGRLQDPARVLAVHPGERHPSKPTGLSGNPEWRMDKCEARSRGIGLASGNSPPDT